MSIDVIALGGMGKKESARFISEFIEFPKRLYADDPHWVPWFDMDMRLILERRHPFFLTGSAEFFLAREGDSVVGRIMVLDIPAYRKEHGSDQAFFYFFDFRSEEAARGLLAAAESWAASLGRRSLEGPFLFGGTSGTGLLVEGFDSPPPMTMMLYNRPTVVETYIALGFERSFDLLSAQIDTSSFKLNDRVARAAELVRKRSGLRVLRFRNKREILARAESIAALYNDTLGDHPEDYPLSPDELEQVKKDLLAVARPDLVKILADGEKVIGFLFAFPDLSPILRKAGGRIGPLVIARLLLAMRRPKRVLVNGMGILKEYRKRGGNALLYAELAETVLGSGAQEAELVQVAESTELMLADLQTLGARVSKRYRVYHKAIG
jgi:hypothetical protein